MKDRSWERHVQRREKLDVWVGNILDGNFRIFRKRNGKIRFGFIITLLVVVILIVNISI